MGHIYVLGRVENHCTFTSDIYKLWEAIGDIPSQRYSLAAVSQPAADNRIGIVGERMTEGSTVICMNWLV